jgi:hypothetical protein
MEFQQASTVCPERVRPDWSVMVTEIMTGRRSSRGVEEILNRMEAGFEIERIKDRFRQEEITPALYKCLDLLVVSLRNSS